MKQVKLNSLHLINFRGAKDRKITFREKETFIKGDNATGKSTIYDAFLWLLFGKDAQDRKDYEIKHIENGRTLEKTDAVVIGELSVDGETVTLKRVFAEDWVKPRGATEQVFKGNHTDYFVNDVPMSMREYQSRVAGIVDDTVFKLITNPEYFPNMKWTDQREQLFRLAGTISDSEIAATKPEYADMLDRISGKSLAEYKTELNAKKKKLKAELEQMQPRIDQTRRMMPEERDWDDLNAQLQSVEQEISDVEKAIISKADAAKQQADAARERQDKINGLKSNLQDIVFRLKSEAKETAFKANSERREIESEIKTTEKEAEMLKRSVQAMTNDVINLQSRIDEKMKSVAALRETWYKENEKEYRGSDVCATCGQTLPEDMRSNARAIFAKEKEAALLAITTRGANENEQIKELEAQIRKTEELRDEAADDAMSKEKSLIMLKERLEALPESVADGEVDYTKDRQYNAIKKYIDELEALPKIEVSGDVDTSELKQKKASLIQTRDEIKSLLSNKDAIERGKAEIDRLEKESRILSQQIADLERDEDVMNDFTKARIEECEKRVNGLFTRVTFKLFDYTNEGNEYEVCVPLVDGVPYPVANTAGQINAGIDIINSLMRFYNVSAPIFIDGRERINEIIDTESQVINLCVSKDKELVII